jgi:hypothetical protein
MDTIVCLQLHYNRKKAARQLACGPCYFVVIAVIRSGLTDPLNGSGGQTNHDAFDQRILNGLQNLLHILHFIILLNLRFLHTRENIEDESKML